MKPRALALVLLWLIPRLAGAQSPPPSPPPVVHLAPPDSEVPPSPPPANPLQAPLPAAPAEPPSWLWVGGGVALIAGSLAIEASLSFGEWKNKDCGWTNMRDDRQACQAAFQGLGTLRLVGAALTTAYGWKLGQYDLQQDLRASRVERSPLRALGWTTAALGVAATLGGALYLVVDTLKQCDTTTTRLEDCKGPPLEKVFLVDLVGASLLASGATMLGYSYGYDSAAKSARRTSLVPYGLRGGGGLVLTTHF